VFANLLNNAAKYTDAGGEVRLRAWLDQAEVVVEVSDNGAGISPETLPHVFDLFVQERQNLERAQGGLGIGLAIVRSLVQVHGGTVQARSAGKGAGTTFVVRLPAVSAAGTAASLPPPGDAVSEGYRVLVVDDNRDAAVLLADSLQLLGHQVEVAHDGPSAIAVASAWRPAAALLDLGLPVMDGFELGERLRALPDLGSLVLIAVTGYAQEPDRRRTTAGGFDGHLAKPIDVYELDGLLRRAVESRQFRR
jgi:CheY-like chemotaxis protein